MKKLIIALSLFLLCSFSDNTITIKKDRATKAKQNLQVVGDYLNKSNLPHKEVIDLLNLLDETYNILSDTSKSKN